MIHEFHCPFCGAPVPVENGFHSERTAWCRDCTRQYMVILEDRWTRLEYSQKLPLDPSCLHCGHSLNIQGRKGLCRACGRLHVMPDPYTLHLPCRLPRRRRWPRKRRHYIQEVLA